MSPLEREQLVGAVRLGIEWDDPDPGRSAPTASITQTQEAISGAATQLDSDMDRDHDGVPDRVEESEHNTVLPPIPTDEWDADVNPDGDDQAFGRPEWFVWL